MDSFPALNMLRWVVCSTIIYLNIMKIVITFEGFDSQNFKIQIFFQIFGFFFPCVRAYVRSKIFFRESNIFFNKEKLNNGIILVRVVLQKDFAHFSSDSFQISKQKIVLLENVGKARVEGSSVFPRLL